MQCSKPIIATDTMTSVGTGGGVADNTLFGLAIKYNRINLILNATISATILLVNLPLEPFVTVVEDDVDDDDVTAIICKIT